MLLVLVCLRGGEAMALWVEVVGLEQSVNEEERDRSKHDGEDTAVLVRWRIHSDPRCSSTTLGQKRHLAQTSPTATRFRGSRQADSPPNKGSGPAAPLSRAWHIEG